MNKGLIWFFKGCVLLLLLWYALSLALGSRIIPAPHTVFPVFLNLLVRGLLAHALSTLGRTLAALAVSFILALPIGIAMGKIRWIDDLLSPVTYLLYPVPKIALLPIVLLLFGITDTAKVSVVALVLFFQILLEVRGSVKSIPREYLLSITTLGAKPSQKVFLVIWPFILPHIFTALRIGSGTALAVLFFAETFFSSRGLGFFIMDSWMRISYPEMFAGILMMALLGLGLFLLIDRLEKLFCPWHRVKEEEPRKELNYRNGRLI